MPVVLAFKAPAPNAVLDTIAPAPFPTRTPDRVASVVEEIAPVTASAPEFTAASVEVPDADSVVNAPADPPARVKVSAAWSRLPTVIHASLSALRCLSRFGVADVSTHH